MSKMDTKVLREKLIALIANADKALLLEIYQTIKQIENDNKVMEEPTIGYKKGVTSLIPDWHMKEVEDRWAKYERGETEMQSWETVKKEIESKYGF